MKRFFLSAVLLVCISAIGFSHGFNFDIWFSAGPAFGNNFMNGTNLEHNYIGSPGINLSYYALLGKKNIGLFFNYGILFPAVNNTGILYEPSVQLDYILLGVGFGYTINKTLKLYFGIGPDMNMPFLHSKENNEIMGDYFIGLGFGGDIGLKFKPVRFLCIDVGTTLSYNFAAYREIRSNIDFRHNEYEIEKSGWVNRYSMLGIKPYILLGFNATMANGRMVL
jgi:hypothetical protein